MGTAGPPGIHADGREVARLTRTARAPSERPPVTGQEAPPVSASTVRARGRSRALRAAGWVALVLCLAAAQLALVHRRFYYGNDDLLQFRVADEVGLSWELLSLNVFQHFGPYNRLAHLAVAGTGMSPAAGLAFMVVNLVAMLAGCLWFMTELGLPTRRRVVGLVLIGLSVTVSESAIWFDTSMHILPAIAVTAAICAAHVRAVRTGRARWHVVTLVLFLAGQLVQERPVFALPLAVLAVVLLLWRDRPWRERLHGLWSLRVPLLVWSLVAAGVAAALQAFVVFDGGGTPGWGTTARTMLLGLTAYVVPGVVNLPLADPPGIAAQLGVLAGVLVAGAVLAKARRGNAGPLLFAAAAFLLYYGFLKLSPLLADTPASVRANAERLHYAVYVIPPLVVALVSLRWPFLQRGRETGVRRRRRTGGWFTVFLASALAVVLVLAGGAYLERRWAATTDARAYMDAVRAQAQRWSDPGVTLVPLWAPAAMTTDWARPLGRHDRLLDLVVDDFEVQDLGDRPVVIDDSGRVRPAELLPVDGAVRIDSGRCGRRTTTPAGDVRAEVADTVARVPAYLVISYRARAATELNVVTDPEAAGGLGFQRIALPAGERTRVIPLDDENVRDLVATGSGLCIEEISIARVAVVEDGDTCRYVDRFGRRTTVSVLCPQR